MPIKFGNGGVKQYSIDYVDLSQKLFSKYHTKLFHDDNLFREYIDNFLRKIELADSRLTENVARNVGFLRNTSLFRYDKFFQLAIKCSNQEIFVHFDIERLLKHTPKHGKHVEKIQIEHFVGPKATIKWAATERKWAGDTEPIIVVPYIDKNRKFVVIEGNQRLPALIEGEMRIPVLFASGDTMIKEDYFLTVFDKIFYAFYCDLSYLVYIKHKNFYTDEELWEESFLTTKSLKI